MQAIASGHADAVDGFYANYVDAVEARNRSILALWDAGWSRPDLAGAFRLTKGRITQIVAETAAVPASSPELEPA